MAGWFFYLCIFDVERIQNFQNRYDEQLYTIRKPSFQT